MIKEEKIKYFDSVAYDRAKWRKKGAYYHKELEKYLRFFIPSAEEANHENLIKAEDFMLKQVREIDVMVKQLDEIKATYQAKYDEVVAWRSELDNKIMIARTSLAVWARAHKNLGAGIPVPPLIDVAGMASNLAGNAAKAVVP